MNIFAQAPEKIKTQYIPEMFREVADATYAALGRTGFYDYGHYAEVTKQLQMKDQGMTVSVRTKYPLIWLVMDFEETFGKETDAYCDINCQLIIATSTEANYNMAQRRDKSFLPVLYPIYSELIYQISESVLFGRPTLRFIEHTKIDRPYWGGQETGNSERNLFNDYIDAIQIKNLKLSVKKLEC